MTTRRQRLFKAYRRGVTKRRLADFYRDMRKLLDDYDLEIESFDDYGGDGRFCGVDFTLRSRTPVNGVYEIYITSINEFTEKL